MLKRMKWLLEKLRRVLMPHVYDLNPHLKKFASRQEPKIVEKAPAPKKRGRPKGSKNKK